MNKAERSGASAERASYLVPIVVFGLLMVLPLIASWAGGNYILSFSTRIMISALAALSLDIVLGGGGLISFGHASFIGIGAYTVGILAANGIDDLLIQTPIALAAAGVFALFSGAISLRTKGVYFIMITLAFGQMLFFFTTSLASYGGDDGLTIDSRSSILGHDVLASETHLYYLAFGVLLVSYLFSRRMMASRFGRVLRGARENAVRMEAIGFSPFAFRLVAYVIAGLMAGLAGVLLAEEANFVSPAYLSWQRSADLIFMVVIGGMGTLHGAIIGAAVFLVSEEVLSGFTDHWRLIFGPVLVAFIIFWRGGFMGRRRHD